jgi:hypothetical protein
MTAAAIPHTPQRQTEIATSGKVFDLHVPCIVTLIDRRTGTAHRVNGSPLTLFTLHPGAAAAELLAGRDGEIWEARVETIGKGARL